MSNPSFDQKTGARPTPEHPQGHHYWVWVYRINGSWNYRHRASIVGGEGKWIEKNAEYLQAYSVHYDQDGGVKVWVWEDGSPASFKQALRDKRQPSFKLVWELDGAIDTKVTLAPDWNGGKISYTAEDFSNPIHVVQEEVADFFIERCELFESLKRDYQENGNSNWSMRALANPLTGLDGVDHWVLEGFLVNTGEGVVRLAHTQVGTISNALLRMGMNQEALKHHQEYLKTFPKSA